MAVFKCWFCKRMTKTKTGLLLHMEQQHEKELKRVIIKNQHPHSFVFRFFKSLMKDQYGKILQ